MNQNHTAITSSQIQALCELTLLELLVVRVIIELLANYAAPKHSPQIGKLDVKTARAQIDAMEKALHQYRVDTGHSPIGAQAGSSIFRSTPCVTK